jgi:hypothetical protein
LKYVCIQDPEHSNIRSEEYTDYHGKRADTRKHGGLRPAAIACGKPNFIVDSNIFLLYLIVLKKVS